MKFLRKKVHKVTIPCPIVLGCAMNGILFLSLSLGHERREVKLGKQSCMKSLQGGGMKDKMDYAVRLKTKQTNMAHFNSRLLLLLMYWHYMRSDVILRKSFSARMWSSSIWNRMRLSQQDHLSFLIDLTTRMASGWRDAGHEISR